MTREMGRSSGCRITGDLTFKQYKAIMLENEKLQLLLLTDRGGEPIRWLHKPSDTDLIWQTRLGLLPPHPLYPDYQMSYPGGWQEMMPEVSYTHEYRGATVHRGETAVTPWDCHIMKDEPEEICVRLTHRLRSLPLYIEKTYTLRSGETNVRIEETVKNEAPVQVETNWGHHLAYGAPFIGGDARISFDPAARIMQPQTGERWPWPHAPQNGEQADLSALPPVGTPRELLCVLPGEGAYRIDSPSRSLALEVRWDKNVWPYVWYWQNYGADGDAPFFSCEYNFGLEMFNVPPKLTLAEAAASGDAIRLAPGGERTAWLEFEVKEGAHG